MRYGTYCDYQGISQGLNLTGNVLYTSLCNAILNRNTAGDWASIERVIGERVILTGTWSSQDSNAEEDFD